jgi:hypothetical protein
MLLMDVFKLNPAATVNAVTRIYLPYKILFNLIT